MVSRRSFLLGASSIAIVPLRAALPRRQVNRAVVSRLASRGRTTTTGFVRS